MNHGEEKKVEMSEDGQKREDEGFSISLLGGEYDEEDSARSFQEALRQWRGERSDGEGEPMTEDAVLTPLRPGELHRHGCCHKDTHVHTGYACKKELAYGITR